MLSFVHQPNRGYTVQLREFMGMFQPVRRHVNCYGEMAGVASVQLTAVIEQKIKNFVSSMKNNTRRKMSAISNILMFQRARWMILGGF